MSRELTAGEVAAYAAKGYASPFRALAPQEAADRLARLEALEAARGGRIPPLLNVKAHLLVPWLWDLVHDPRIVAPVRSILGPDLVVWAASFFAKSPGDRKHVPWHQDATYWGLSEPRALTAWVAFSPSGRDNGCLRVVPGTHRAPVAHRASGTAGNMLPGGEEIAVEVDEAEAVDIVLQPGEMSLHHLLLVHGSQPNAGGARRVGFAIRYIAADVAQSGAVPVSATLVAGRDHGLFAREEAPEAEFHPAAVARHAEIMRQWVRMVAGEVRRHTA